MCRKFLVGVILAAAVSCAKTKDYTAFGIGPVPPSVISRESGVCYAQCPPGTKCVEQTGLCKELPCRGLCADNEHCGTDNRCHQGSTESADFSGDTEKATRETDK